MKAVTVAPGIGAAIGHESLLGRPMDLSEYIVLFVLVVTMGVGIPP